MQVNYWQDAIKHLTTQDDKLALIIKQFPNLVLKSDNNAFITLIRAIIGQQISIKAADSVWMKLKQNIKPFNQKTVLKHDTVKLKSFGLSQQKAQYIHNIANYFVSNNIDKNYWQNYSYKDISNNLIAIKGIGNWTVEMFAIFYLLEPDIFPIKDLGLVRAINNIYAPKNHKLSNEQIMQIAKQWQPFRTVATWFLWRSIDAEVVVY